MYHGYARRRKTSIIVPFLTLIIVILTAAFAFEIVSYLRAEREIKTENKAAVTVFEGRAQMRLYGDENWVPAVTGSILREGDAVKALAGSRLALKLLNGSTVRLNGDTEVSIYSLRTYDDEDDLALRLAYGELWLRHATADLVDTNFSVLTDDFMVRSLGTVFAVNKRSEFNVFVLEGDVALDIKEVVDEKERVFETFDVGVGQQVRISESALKTLRERQRAEVLFKISDTFEDSLWYAWNVSQDAKAEEISEEISVADAVDQAEPDKADKNDNDTAVAKESTSEDSGLPDAPTVVSPKEGDRTVKEGQVIIRGTVSKDTQSVRVKTFIDGKEDAYTLQRYTPGSTEWSYIAQTTLKNFVKGKNRFEIVAIDVAGRESPPTPITINYDPDGYDEPKEELTDNSEESVVLPADLSAPGVVSYNDTASTSTTFTTQEENVRIGGSIGKGIEKVIVNDFQLTKYVPGSGAWAYYPKIEYENYVDGENKYRVYGVDASGNKTPVTTVIIIKEPNTEPVVESVVAPKVQEAAPEVAPVVDVPVKEPVVEVERPSFQLDIRTE
jgi:hypothetical protein